MKNLLSITILLSLSFSAFSQKDSIQEPDTTKIKIGNSRVIILKDAGNDDYDFDLNSMDSSKCKTENNEDGLGLSFDFGMAGYLTPDQSTTLPASQNLIDLNYSKSNSIGFTFMFQEARLIKKRLYVRSGIGLNWNNYHFRRDINLYKAGDSLIAQLDTVKSFSKNKLRANYIQVPLLLGTRIGNLNNPLGIQVGVIGSYKLGSAVKQKYSLNGKESKDKFKDDYYLNPFKLEAIARVSIDQFGIYARYSFTTLFEANKAPELYPFSVGITIGGF